MKLAINQFAQALKSEHQQLGLWESLSNRYAAELVAHSGFDWVEHSPNDLQTVLGQLQAFEGSRTTALVRPPWNDAVMVKRLLDLGAQGLLFPMIQTADDAKLAVASTRYPPNGVRGVAGSTRATKFGRIKNYAKEVEAQTSVIMQLETRSALEQADEIAAVDGVDAIFFGPADIAADLGLVGESLSDDVWSLIMPVAKRLIDKGVPVGTLVLDSAFAIKLLNQGFSFVACGADTALLASSVDELLNNVKIAVSQNKKGVL